MIQEDLLVKVIDKINSLNIPYMITGGIAVIFFGKPRLTHDFDIVVEIQSNQIRGIVETFEKDFYISSESIQEAIEHHSMFNIIHFDSGIKIDFWMLRNDAFDMKRFERRQRHIYSGREIVFSSSEDTILKKLLWYKESDIEKHLEDAGGILQLQQNLDLDYLKEWAKKLTVGTLLDELLRSKAC